MLFLWAYSKPETVDAALIGERESSARTIKSGTCPKIYRPPPSAQKLFVSNRKPLNTSAFKFTKPPPPFFEKLVPVGDGLEFHTLNSRTSPPTSAWNLFEGSNASLAMKSGATFGVPRVVPPVFSWVPPRAPKTDG